MRATLILFGYAVSLALSFVVFVTYGLGLNLKDGNFHAFVYSIFPYEGYIEGIAIISSMVLSIIGYILYTYTYLEKNKENVW